MFIDLSLNLIDGLTRLENTPTRYLHFAFQNDVYKYEQYDEREFHSHNMFHRATMLHQQSLTLPLSDETFPHRLEMLDLLILQLQLKAEQKCCQLRTKFDSSDGIHFTKRSVLYWQIKQKPVTRSRDTDKICLLIYESLPGAYQKLIDIARGAPKQNWVITEIRLKSLLVQHRKAQSDLKHDLLDNEAKHTGSTIDKVKSNQERIQKDKKL
jgi:hypothetical protein